ncbi:TetR/AcrR family transcriptional regulator [Paenibacillus validus]|uniref:TetR family transcriptional regulator n=1 Tax=Paenibacillus validus TaxID=44253 RepID=A0A7X3CR09_9BACL|nr:MULTISPECIES: TetR/AcrR family transcriptional regulator [Paenibacillus]MED4601212.1 TetR/AcrR family transcriptional regulator [Paenibacillus validus]MED4606905.1 TetR/AcrR family transcriptional regulator [Paenibacillus validus]MUG69251.1 TetR family transcriptional regulator [Paenibacillus validus]
MARKKIDKTDAILQAALKVFAEHGFNGAQISKIAKEAGVADGTIYLYFQNKEDILTTVYRTTLTGFTQLLTDRLKETLNADAAIHAICEILFTFMEENVHIAYLNIVELRQHPMELRKEISQYTSPFFRLIEDVLQKGKEEGAFRPNLEVKHARRLLFGAMDQVISSWLISGRKYSLTSLIESTTEFLIKGLK